MPEQIQPPSEKSIQPHTVKMTGALKRDINLMPANESSAKLARRGAVALGVFVGLLIVAYFAILTPALALKALQEQTAAAENRAALLQSVQADSLAKQAERDKKAQILAYVSGMTTEYAPPSDIMAKLERACPGAIVLTSFNLDVSGMTIDGYAGNDKEVAEFLVNLGAAFPQYAEVALVYTKDAAQDARTAMKRQFQVSAKIAAPSATPAETAAPAGEPKGGDAQ